MISALDGCSSRPVVIGAGCMQIDVASRTEQIVKASLNTCTQVKQLLTNCSSSS